VNIDLYMEFELNFRHIMEKITYYTGGKNYLNNSR